MFPRFLTDLRDVRHNILIIQIIYVSFVTNPERQLNNFVMPSSSQSMGRNTSHACSVLWQQHLELRRTGINFAKTDYGQRHPREYVLSEEECIYWQCIYIQN